MRILVACINCDQMSDIIGCHALDIPDGLLSANIDAIADFYHHSVLAKSIIYLIMRVILLFILFDFEL